VREDAFRSADKHPSTNDIAIEGTMQRWKKITLVVFLIPVAVIAALIFMKRTDSASSQLPIPAMPAGISPGDTILPSGGPPDPESLVASRVAAEDVALKAAAAAGDDRR
jgi:hypothetical protein